MCADIAGRCLYIDCLREARRTDVITRAGRDARLCLAGPPLDRRAVAVSPSPAASQCGSMGAAARTRGALPEHAATADELPPEPRAWQRIPPHCVRGAAVRAGLLIDRSFFGVVSDGLPPAASVTLGALALGMAPDIRQVRSVLTA